MREARIKHRRFLCLCAVFIGALISLRCSSNKGAVRSDYFGKVAPPDGRVLRYVSGPEPESLDPQIGTYQFEYRIYMAFYEGLTEYDSQTIEPIPAIAESWEINRDYSEFTFHLRRDARWSNGEAITARDFVYSWRRGLSPALAARNASLAFCIKYAQGYNANSVFVRDPQSGGFLSDNASPASRLVLPGDAPGREALLAADANLRAAVAGREYVPITAEDIGVAAPDDYTLRVTLEQPTPFFLALTSHPFFRVVPRAAIEAYGSNNWTTAPHIVCSGPFMLSHWRPYDKIVAVKNPYYWDAARVRLDGIVFYPIEESTTAMNMYKAGAVDAVGNHLVPAAWFDAVRRFKDYKDEPELAIQFYIINVTKPPMNDVRVRKAFNMAVDKRALAEYRRTAKPLAGFIPAALFEGYPNVQGDKFDPARAKALLAQAGYADAAGAFDASKFPADQVELFYNNASNREVAEFLQAQWSQNLGISVSMRAMETNTFLEARKNLEYKGFARNAFAADYNDPFTFLNVFTDKNNGTGWYDEKYNQMLARANLAPTAQERYQMLAAAEKYLLDAQPMLPLYVNATNLMIKPYVKGIYPNAGSLYAWKFVSLADERGN